MTKKGENIYKRKDNRWEGRYLKGHNEYGKRQIGYVYGKSYREVKEKLTEAKEHLEAIPEEIRALPFSCICAQWLRQQHNTVKQSTYAKYVRLLDTHILTAFGTLPLSTTIFLWLISLTASKELSILLLKLYNDGAIGISSPFLDFASVNQTDNQLLIRSVRFMQVESS